MYMDFSKDVMEGQGHGNYDRLPTENLPPLWLAYLSDPSNSGKIHSDVKARWLQGDQVVVDGMKSFARFADLVLKYSGRNFDAALGSVRRGSNGSRLKQLYEQAGTLGLFVVVIALQLAVRGQRRSRVVLLRVLRTSQVDDGLISQLSHRTCG